MLGCAEALATELAFLDLEFVNGRLYVHPRAKDNDRDIVERVTACLMEVFGLRKFTASRWGSIKETGQHMVALTHLGLDHLIEAIRADPTFKNDWYLHTFAYWGVTKYRILCCSCDLLVDIWIV